MYRDRIAVSTTNRKKEREADEANEARGSGGSSGRNGEDGTVEGVVGGEQETRERRRTRKKERKRGETNAVQRERARETYTMGEYGVSWRGTGKDSYATTWTRPGSQYIAPSNEIAHKALFHVQIPALHLVRHRYGFEHRLTPTPFRSVTVRGNVILAHSPAVSSRFSWRSAQYTPLKIRYLPHGNSNSVYYRAIYQRMIF